jgi:hypothetical protein
MIAAAMKHLNASEEFTPHPQYAEADNQDEHSRAAYRLAPGVMEGRVVPLAQSHEAYSCDIHGYH